MLRGCQWRECGKLADFHLDDVELEQQGRGRQGSHKGGNMSSEIRQGHERRPKPASGWRNGGRSEEAHRVWQGWECDRANEESSYKFAGINVTS